MNNLGTQLQLLNAACARKDNGQKVSLDPLIQFAISVCQVANQNNKNREKVALGLEFITEDMKNERGYSSELWNKLSAQKENLLLEREKGITL